MSWFALSMAVPFALLVLVTVFLALLRLACRSLPESHPLRSRVQAATDWIRSNPRRFGVSLEYVATGLFLGYFLVLLVLYG
ncbi:MAG: hypothetical protein J7598_09530 [Mitsuaria chitosanitabida]|uniref:hypothetical protein n=1 Tax=Roseateles chitosanitabidus TaxID=65048 RepID=UPI001B0BACB5|nr:hypothetical protein [Roseateles chitosanitabidus]MBO9686840.1 hypothetical protein [Roseateles chitosanitabidus]